MVNEFAPAFMYIAAFPAGGTRAGEQRSVKNQRSFAKIQ
jgi:hypothetical protein